MKMHHLLDASAILCAMLASSVITSAHAESQTATLVKVTETFNWAVPSTDPTGVVFAPGADSLFVTDSEVNETVLFNGSNMFQTGLDGSVYELFSTLDFTDEPTGITINPANGHLFISVDNAPRRIHEIDPGPDGIYRNADDIITSFSTTDFGCYDAEGITYNPIDGRLYIADGLPNLVHVIDPGPNRLFDGIAPVGDDTVTSFDTAGLGITDPEGIVYDSLTDALYLIGEPIDQLLHATTSGEFLRLITLDSTLLKKPAGLGIGPSSLENGAESLYLVDRGVDNDYDPSENDGRLFEFTLPPVPGNEVPVVTLTAPQPGQTFEVDSTVTFAATATDPEEGDLSAALVWESDLDGVIGYGQAFSTSTLSTGLHTITASCTDASQAAGLASLSLRIYPEGTHVVEMRIDSSSDDAEQRGLDGNTWLDGNDLELIDDNGVEQIVGLRFNTLQIPTYAIIEEAYIQFQADESQLADVTLEIRAQDSDDAEEILGRTNNLTQRATTAASSIWQPVGWATVGESGLAQKSSDLASLVQEVVNRPGWSPGNSMAFLITGSGPERRTAESYDSEPAGAPLLYVRYSDTPSAPMLIVSSPVSGDLFAHAATVTLTATAEDIQDGELSGSIAWDSDLDGALGTGSTLTLSSLSTGTHVISATVTDSSCLSSSEMVSITIEPPVNTPPILAIDSPLDGMQTTTDTVVQLSATATDDEDGDLSALVNWSSDLDGELGAGSLAVYLSEGQHLLTAWVSDGGNLTAMATVTLQVDAIVIPDVTQVVRVDAGTDDAEERDKSGRMALTSSDLELVMDKTRPQVVGIRFNDLQIPKDAGIVSASIQFQADETASDLTFLEIFIEESDNPATFTLNAFDITSRPRSHQSVQWLPSPWNTVGSAGAEQQTPNLGELVQLVVTRENWTPGNSMVFLVDGDGTRTAEAYEGSVDAAPQLTITYTMANKAPTVATSPDVTLFLPDSAFISGTIDDDGNPEDPGTLTYQWSMADGPGTVTFSDPASLSTTASFDSVGTYVLILNASDGQLTGSDTLTVVVESTPQNEAPVVAAGPDQQLDLGDIMTLDGSVTDDGLPNPVMPVTISWTQLSGPGTAVIIDPGRASTTVDYTEAGSYTFELNAFDGELVSSDEVTVTVNAPVLYNDAVTIQIIDSADDMEEFADGGPDLVSSDLELTYDKSEQLIGMRFQSVPVPAGAIITSAHVQFTVDEVDTDVTDLLIYGENADDSAPFVREMRNISSRQQTQASVLWTPPAWTTKGESGEAQQTPDLATVIQEIVDRPGWISGNALSIIVTGSGVRTAESFDGEPGSAARLSIDFQYPE